MCIAYLMVNLSGYELFERTSYTNLHELASKYDKRNFTINVYKFLVQVSWLCVTSIHLAV